MARFLSKAVNLSYKNYVTTGFVLNRHYSVLYSCNKFNTDTRIQRNASPQKIQHRNFSWEGYLRFMDKLSNSYVCSTLRDSLISFHDATGLPWWSAIILATSAARIALMCITGIYQEKVVSELYINRLNDKNKAKEIEQEALALAKKNQWTLEKTIKIIKSEKKSKLKDFGDRFILLLTRTVILIFTQIGLWIMISLSLRSINILAITKKTEAAETLKQQLRTEGCLWFKDLFQPDRFILPALVVVSNFVILEIQDLKHGTKTKLFTKILRVLIVGMGYICSLIPSNICLFWAVSSYVALAQNLLMLSPRIRKIFRIDPLVMLDDPKHPYRNLWKRFKIKWRI